MNEFLNRWSFRLKPNPTQAQTTGSSQTPGINEPRHVSGENGGCFKIIGSAPPLHFRENQRIALNSFDGAALSLFPLGSVQSPWNGDGRNWV